MILTVAQMQEVEQAAFARGIKAADLMEEAGAGIACVVEQFFPIDFFPNSTSDANCGVAPVLASSSIRYTLSPCAPEAPGDSSPEASLERSLMSGTCVVYCGKGNNAGDALVAARYLAECGWKILVRLSFLREEMAPLPQSHLQTLLQEYDAKCIEKISKIATYPLVLLDGVLGIGAQGAPRGPLATFIEEMNKLRRECGAFTVAVDLPSGLDLTTGVPSECCVEADLTVTIAYAKTGLLADTATNNVGRLAVVPLTELKSSEGDEGSLITPKLLQASLPSRSFDVHKGMFGHVGIIAGSRGYLGAARLAATAALHAGAGLVTLYGLPETYELLAVSVPPEVMVKPIACYTDVLLESLHALVIGPGLGLQYHSEILEIIEKATIPCLIDADALNALAREMPSLLKAHGPRLVTPHPGEMERLFPRQDRTRVAWATDFVEKYSVTLLLKGARTIIAEQKQPLVYNTTGNPGMAAGGMGDVLSGVAAAFLAAGHQPREAAMLGAWLCGHAAELSIFQGTASQESLVASDIINNLGRAMKNLRAGVF
ncbi:MAG: NAD(P)H-hydrate dehydratase [Chthoniobacterales bacterium]|nr:NAD(P)H-hydrate dehydratase [Chthoniobacterales bacterium]